MKSSIRLYLPISHSAVVKYITLWAQILPKNVIDQKQGWLKVQKKEILFVVVTISYSFVYTVANK